jgi:hypothetical protein
MLNKALAAIEGRIVRNLTPYTSIPQERLSPSRKDRGLQPSLRTLRSVNSFGARTGIPASAWTSFRYTDRSCLSARAYVSLVAGAETTRRYAYLGSEIEEMRMSKIGPRS